MKEIRNKKERGITLIALVVTIIVLIILAGVSINLVFGNLGVVTKSKEAVEETNKNKEKEKLELVLTEAYIEKMQNKEYNSNEFLDNIIKKTIPNAKIEKDKVIIENYKFLIDRENLKIIKIEKIDINNEDSIDNESLIGKIYNVSKSGYQEIEVNGKIGENEESEKYAVNVIINNGDLILDGKNEVEGATLNSNVYEFGNENIDVANQSEDAKYMVILKVNGNLTINQGITLTACKSNNGYGGPKGLVICCTGNLINNGTISMTKRGAKAEGQNIYLWKNKDGSYEYVPKLGAIGGSSISVTRSKQSEYWLSGNKGKNGSERQTGGGGTGGITSWGYNAKLRVAAGGIGTSYSGGVGSGAIVSHSDNITRLSSTVSQNGGTGGKGYCVRSNEDWTIAAGGGAGNSGGAYAAKYGGIGNKGEDGTGGLLIIYAKTFDNSGNIESNGANGGNGEAFLAVGGGASGGGSINIFSKNIKKKGKITVKGGIGGSSYYSEPLSASTNKGGNGGEGTISIGTIKEENYLKYTETTD